MLEWGLLLLGSKLTIIKVKAGFTFYKLGYFLIPSVLTLSWYFYRFGQELIIVYLLFSALGTFLEWLLGFLFRQIMGENLWKYSLFPIGSYTSYLAIPLWGLAGVLFWLTARMLL